MKKREYWVDAVKIFACILVCVGHLYQGLVEPSILPNNQFFQWFNTTIYYFHVPLFFICSGYLYQKYTKINTFKEYKSNVVKKIISLGIPFVFFTIVTYLFKVIFSSSVNNEVGGIVDILLFHPTSVYWYIYSLLFIFIVIPTLNNTKRDIVVISLVVISKLIATINILDINIFVINTLMQNSIWFLIGMILSKYLIDEKVKNYKYTPQICVGGDVIICSL